MIAIAVFFFHIDLYLKKEVMCTLNTTQFFQTLFYHERFSNHLMKKIKYVRKLLTNSLKKSSTHFKEFHSHEASVLEIIQNILLFKSLQYSYNCIVVLLITIWQVIFMLEC